MVNSHLVDDRTIRKAGFGLPRRHWSLLNHIRTVHCGACRKIATSQLWPVCLWRATNNVSHRRLLSIDKAGWWLVQAALCRWWCCCV